MIDSSRFYLHQLVWKDQPEVLEKVLANDRGEHDYHDPKHGRIHYIDRQFRGLSPLSLAAQLGRSECVRVLLKHNADTLITSELGFYPLMDATGLGDRKIMQEILVKRHEQIRQVWLVRQPFLFNALMHETPDFYVELHWQFKSWIPFLSMLCPSDCYRIWKRGSTLRVDTTLVGFERMRWIRGNISYLFKVGERSSDFFLLDHDKKMFEEVNKLEDYSDKDIEEDLNMRLNTDIVTAKIKKPGDAVIFERQKGGPFGLGGFKEDIISGYRADVYDIKDIEFITKTRKEHLRDRPGKKGTATTTAAAMGDILDKDTKDLQNISPDSVEIDGMLQDAKKLMYEHVPSLPAPNTPCVSYHEYFDEGSITSTNNQLPYIHVGRPLEYQEKIKSFKLAIWMAENYPITVAQLLPVFEILSPTNKHVEKLREFISMDLPPGFPVQVEMPLFAVLTAQVTFKHFQPWTRTSRNAKLPTTTNTLTANGAYASKIPCPLSITDNVAESEWFKVPEGYQPGVVIKNIFKKYEDD